MSDLNTDESVSFYSSDSYEDFYYNGPKTKAGKPDMRTKAGKEWS